MEKKLKNFISLFFTIINYLGYFPKKAIYKGPGGGDFHESAKMKYLLGEGVFW